MLTLIVSAASPEQPLIARAVDALGAHGIVAYPTDTLYGLAVDPRSDAAVERLFEVKGRHAGVAIPLIAASLEQAQELATFTDADLRLARAFWPGPLTLVLQPRQPLSPRVLGGGRTVAVRVPANNIACALAAAFGFCITATSANRSGDAPARSADAALTALGDAIDLVLDGGPSEAGPASTIVETGDDGPRLVRAGAVPFDRVLRSLE
ncbi:MAG TPA: L-threonylcarbamoyladenylate synthase [Vicinamibacterales bacterium]|nr:L-threonylcarbamoyladenylate synthase [Vicinamibacterales bacterium]